MEATTIDKLIMHRNAARVVREKERNGMKKEKAILIVSLSLFGFVIVAIS